MALAGWLTAHVPDDGAKAVLLWGDPGPHNVLTDDRATITAVLDWELAMVGHPGVDLGAARWSCLGHLDPDVLAAAYVAEGGELPDPPVLAWFEVLACVSRSAMLLDGVRAALDGRCPRPQRACAGHGAGVREPGARCRASPGPTTSVTSHLATTSPRPFSIRRPSSATGCSPASSQTTCSRQSTTGAFAGRSGSPPPSWRPARRTT